MALHPQNVFVDLDGKTYRVCFFNLYAEKVLLVIRRGHNNSDVGLALALDGRTAKRAIAAAREQRRK